MYILNVNEWPYYMCIQGLLLASNNLYIMVTLGLYFEYINVVYKIFARYTVAILQFYPCYLIILLKMIKNDIYRYYYLLLYYKYLIFNIIFLIKINK
jgi:hypothetical protein